MVVINTTTINTFREAQHGYISTVSCSTIILGVFFVLLMLVTVIGNVMVFMAIYQNRRLRTPFNYFVANLAVTDVSVGSVVMGFYTIYTIMGYWPFGGILCGLWICVDYGMTFESIFTLVMISVERFWAVTWTLHHKRHSTKQKARIAITLSWIVVFALWIPAFITDRLKNKKTDVCIWEPAENTISVIVLATIGYHGPCFILLFCYIKVFTFMKKRLKSSVVLSMSTRRSAVSIVDLQSSITNLTDIAERSENVNDSQIDQPEHIVRLCVDGTCSRSSSNPSTDTETSTSYINNESGANQEDINHFECEPTNIRLDSRNNSIRQRCSRKRAIKENKIFITLTYVMIGYLICWLPFHFAFDIRAVNQALVPETVYTITFWMAYMNSTLNPFLYNLSNADFRSAFKKMICLCK